MGETERRKGQRMKYHHYILIKKLEAGFYKENKTHCICTYKINISGNVSHGDHHRSCHGHRQQHMPISHCGIKWQAGQHLPISHSPPFLTDLPLTTAMNRSASLSLPFHHHIFAHPILTLTWLVP